MDCNRRPTHRSLFSFVTRTLPALQKSDILNTYHRPHWSAIEAAVAKRILAKRTVVHLGVHSFTPILKGNVRRCDIGLLYDPSRRKEKSFCRAWQKSLKQTLPGCTIRRNYPYRGNADGLTTWLRSRHGQGYLGIELEVNQKYLQPDNDSRSLIEEALVHTLRPLLDHEAGD